MDVYPFVEVLCVLAMNPEKTALYFTLAFVSGFLVSFTCMCGHWMALKLAPIANDRSSMFNHQSTMTHDHHIMSFDHTTQTSSLLDELRKNSNVNPFDEETSPPEEGRQSSRCNLMGGSERASIVASSVHDHPTFSSENYAHLEDLYHSQYLDQYYEAADNPPPSHRRQLCIID